MKLLEQYSYRTEHSWRPQPTISSEESLQFYGVSFSWGEIDLSQKAFENIRIFVEASLNQSEVTNPFGFNEGLSSLENALYSGCSQANDVIHRLINSMALTSGLEGVWIVKKAKELALIQIGQPQVYLIRKHSIIPLFSITDIISSTPNNGLFLPNKLLGVHSKTHYNIQSINFESSDELILLAHSLVPLGLIESSKSQVAERGKLLFSTIAKEYPLCPFWISRFKFE